MTAETGIQVERHIGEAGEFSLRLPAGSVEVSAVAGDTVRVQDLDNHELADRFTIEQVEGGLHLAYKEARQGLLVSRRGPARLRIEIPANARVSVETASADVRADGLAGEQRYRTASGELSLVNVAGTVRLETMSGDAEVALIGEAELDARTVSGDVTATGGRLPAFVVQTTSGDLRVESSLPGPGPYSIRTVSGGARIVTSDALHVKSATVTGTVRTSRAHEGGSGRGRTVIDVGVGGSPMAFQSISGDLVIESPGAPTVQPRLASEANVPQAIAAPESQSSAAQKSDDDQRLAILRDLEAGRIDVAEATVRLALIKEGD